MVCMSGSRQGMVALRLEGGLNGLALMEALLERNSPFKEARELAVQYRGEIEEKIPHLLAKWRGEAPIIVVDEFVRRIKEEVARNGSFDVHNLWIETLCRAIIQEKILGIGSANLCIKGYYIDLVGRFDADGQSPATLVDAMSLALDDDWLPKSFSWKPAQVPIDAMMHDLMAGHDMAFAILAMTEQ